MGLEMDDTDRLVNELFVIPIQILCGSALSIRKDAQDLAPARGSKRQHHPDYSDMQDQTEPDKES